MCNPTICVKFSLSYFPGWHRGLGREGEQDLLKGCTQQTEPGLHQPFARPSSVCPSPSASSPLCLPLLSACPVAPIPVTQVSRTPDGVTTKSSSLQFSCHLQGGWSPASIRRQSSKFWLHVLPYIGPVQGQQWSQVEVVFTKVLYTPWPRQEMHIVSVEPSTQAEQVYLCWEANLKHEAICGAIKC